MTWPVTCPADGEARNVTSAAASAVVPGRPLSVSAISRCLRASVSVSRKRPGTPAGSIGVITRIWRIGKLLADDRRRTLAGLGIDAAPLDLLSTLRRRARRTGSPPGPSPS